MDIIFDIDGTLANNNHRRHWVECIGKKNWQAFNMEADMDTTIEPIATLARSLRVLAHRILLTTGRTEEMRAMTERWLQHHQIRYDVMYMRPCEDYRQDAVIKEELLDRMIDEGYRPELVFDDRSQCVNLWRRRGLICCQVAEGNF